ncbi:MAG: hypothetical protein ACXAB4_03080 [Candidatus Hodarchaeales archaeon]
MVLSQPKMMNVLEIRQLKEAKLSELLFFRVILAGSTSFGLFSLVEGLSHYSGFLISEMTPLVNKRTEKSIAINYRVLEIPDIHGYAEKHLKQADALVFIVPHDPFNSLLEFRSLIFTAQNRLKSPVPILVLIDQPEYNLYLPVAAIINELRLADLVDKGVCHVGIYPICMQTGEGLYDALWWLFNLFAEKLQKMNSPSNTISNKAVSLLNLANNGKRENFNALVS